MWYISSIMECGMYTITSYHSKTKYVSLYRSLPQLTKTLDDTL